MGKWSPLSRAPVPLGTPVWQSGWDLGSSPFPPSRLRANLALHLAQMYPLLPAPHPTSGRALGCYGHPFPTLQSEGPFQNSNSTMILPAADPSQGKVQGTGLAFKALHSSAPAHLTPCPPRQPPLYPLPDPQPHLSCQDSPHPSAPAIPLVWNALTAACFVSPRILLLGQQGPMQRALLQADFPKIPAVVGFSSLAQLCSPWTAQTPLLTWNLSASSLYVSPGFLSLCTHELRKAWLTGLLPSQPQHSGPHLEGHSHDPGHSPKDKAQCEIKMERDLFIHSLHSLTCILLEARSCPNPPPWLSPTKPCSLADKPPPATNLLCQGQEIQPRHPVP